MSELLIPGYSLRVGSGIDRALLLKFMQLTYKELYPEQDFSHLAKTIDQYFSSQTPLWWVDVAESVGGENWQHRKTVACLWVGNAIDQVSGDRHAHIFLIYVVPEYRRQGIASALVKQAEIWAKNRGDRQIGLQVFMANQPALSLYNLMGFQPVSIWMIKSLKDDA